MTTKKQIKQHLFKQGRSWMLFVDYYTAGKLIDRKKPVIVGDWKRKDALSFAWLLLNFLEPNTTKLCIE